MKLSPHWIREYVDLAVDDARLAEDLTNVGISVEGINGNGENTVFEMEIGTNRPDAMNHYGVAREAAAIYDLPLKAIVPRLPARAGSAALKLGADQKQAPEDKAPSRRGSHGTAQVVTSPEHAAGAPAVPLPIEI